MPTIAERVRGLAGAYGRRSRVYAAVLDPTLEQMTRDTLEIAGIAFRQRVLDLASGTGAIARAATVVGARVVALDVSPGMMVTARHLSPPSIGFVVADAGVLPLRARRFDVVTCGLSLTHFADVSAVLGEVRRVLRVGGVFVASSWGLSGTDPSFSAVLAAFRKYTGNRPRPFSGLVDEESWSSPERGREIIDCARFDAVRVTTRNLKGTYPNTAAAIEWALAWPLTAEGLDQIDPASQATLRAEARAAVESKNDLHWEREVHYYRATAPEASLE